MKKGDKYIQIVDTSIFKKEEKKKLNKENFIQHKIYNTDNTTQKIQTPENQKFRINQKYFQNA